MRSQKYEICERTGHSFRYLGVFKRQNLPYSVTPVKRLKEFYHKYKDYGLVDSLMYLSFFLFLAILFIFFRD